MSLQGTLYRTSVVNSLNHDRRAGIEIKTEQGIILL